jgi:CsoR family transcriptional regulator, copper-sensing transcriptional repressor
MTDTESGSRPVESGEQEADESQSGQSRSDGSGQQEDRAERWESKLAIPVLVAALASVPAVFLTLLDEPFDTVGTVVNWASGAVLVAETVVLYAVSSDRKQWVKDHKWLILLTAIVVPAVILAVGPFQLLRLLRVFGALRIVRAGRIIKAARILREKMGLDAWWSRIATVVAGLLVAAFVGVVLADPSSQSREMLEDLIGEELDTWVAVVLALVAGAILAGATLIVFRYNRQKSSSDS